MQIFQRILCLVEHFIGSRRNIVFFHQFLGKCLAAFQNRRIFARTECTDPGCFQLVYQASDKRIIHADDNEVDLFFLCELGQTVKFHRADRNALCQLRNSGVAGRTVNLLCFRALCHACSDRMLSAAASHNQNFHMNLHIFRRLRCYAMQFCITMR